MSGGPTKQTPNTGRRGPSLARKKPPSESNDGFAAKPRVVSSTSERIVKKLRLSKALTVPDTTSVADACKRMATRRADAALLTNSSAVLCGIITDKDVAIRVVAEGLRPEETPVSKVMTRNPTFVMSTSLAVEALEKMVQGKFRHLPVVENGEVVALLDITKCLYDAIVRMERAALKGNAIAAAVQDVERQWGNAFAGQSNMVESLKERMFRPNLAKIVGENPKVATVVPGDSVFTAAKRMRELKVSSVVVIAGGKPVGILTSKDVLMRIVATGMSAETPVEKIMTTNPECGSLEMTIVDALHTMHDGKFLHLPVLNRDGHVVACVDVLQISHAAFANVGGDVNNMMHKFWESTLGQEQSIEDDDETRSEASARVDLHPDGARIPNNNATLVFKLEDKKGRVHRFHCGSETLADLVAVIKNRVGDIAVPQILYEDDEGDRVLLSTDTDLVDAMSFARISGSKGLRLFLDDSTVKPVKQAEVLTKEKAALGHSSALDLATNSHWSMQTTATAIAAGATMVAGFSLLAYLRRSNQ